MLMKKFSLLVLVVVAILILPGAPAQAQIAKAIFLKDIRPGAGDSIDRDYARMVSNGKYVFFTADDGVHGLQLWRSDGTGPGTIMLTNSTTGLISHGSELVADSKGHLFFGGTDPEHGFELWTSDGTVAGTRLALDLNTGPQSGLSPHLGTLGAQVVFAGTTGTESGIWLSDGTLGGTSLIKDHSSGSDILNMVRLASVQNGTIYYTGFGTGGGMLWKSDGINSSAVTQHLNLFNSMFAPEIAEYHDRIFFEQLTDQNYIMPRVADTSTLGDSSLLHANLSQSQQPYGTSPLLFKNKVYLAASRNYPSYEATKIYCADVDATTTTVTSLPGVPARGFDIYGDPQALVDAGDRMLLWTSGGLWSLDGTPQGTTLLKAIWVQDPNSTFYVNNRYNDSHLAPVPTVVRIPGQRRWVFGANARDGHGTELWWTDGTREGTALLADLNPATSGTPENITGSSEPWNLTFLGNKLFLSATDPTHGRELWLLVLPNPRTPVVGWDQFR